MFDPKLLRELHKADVRRTANEVSEIIYRMRSMDTKPLKLLRNKEQPPFLRDAALEMSDARFAFLKELQEQVPRFVKAFDLLARKYRALLSPLNAHQILLLTHLLRSGGSYHDGYIVSIFEYGYDPRSDSELTGDQAGKLKTFTDVRERFEALIKKYNLEKMWIRDALVDALDARRVYREAHLAPLLSRVDTFDMIDFAFTFRGIRSIDSEKRYRAAAEKAFTESLKEYIANTKKEGISKGNMPPGGRGSLTGIKYYIQWAILNESVERMSIAAFEDPEMKLQKKGQYDVVDETKVLKRLYRLRDKWDLPNRRRSP